MTGSLLIQVLPWIHCLPLIHGWVEEVKGSGGRTTHASLRDILQHLQENFKVFPGQRVLLLGVLSQWDVSREPPEGDDHSRRRPNQVPEPPQLMVSDEEKSSSPSKTKLLNPDLRLSPAPEEAHFTSSSDPDQYIMVFGEARSNDVPVNQEVCLLAQLHIHQNRPEQPNGLLKI